MIRVYVRITSPEDGLYYSAICPHGRSAMHFDTHGVESTTGAEKVSRLATAHRVQTGCACLAEDERP